jgi:amino acid transporter/mannitol/fructose-specific phosphotransferase system IIA component (Ntr-type)
MAFALSRRADARASASRCDGAILKNVSKAGGRKLGEGEKLKKSLKLFDVFAISTGAMFSSGFFLLPGIAAAQTGPSVILAYFVAGLLILPAMLSKAELATAMPRAGGSYYFIDRAMGPLVGTVGGIGTWLSLVLKTAFALIGMGAYLALYVEVPIKPLAVGLTVAFTGLNIVGAKESSGLQRWLVGILLGVLGYFLAQGLFEILQVKDRDAVLSELTPFFTDGASGFAATVGLVFVSYAGLTKVASVAEEVQDPDRAIPLGMWLSVITATVVYCVGVFIMVAVLDPNEFRHDMTPVATAAEAFFSWIPGGGGVLLAVVAAIAAFASTGNAGIMSASRYPLAMGRDHLIPRMFTAVGRFSTPTMGILVTAASIILTIIIFDVAAVAKLASAFQLLIFGIINLCVIVMRESRLEYYHPGYRSPLYPWVQLVGIIAPIWLIAEMGWLPSLFSLGVIVFGVIWYWYYARARTERHGAIHHVFERLGRVRDESVDRELRTILGEKGLREEDPFEEVVAGSEILEFENGVTFEQVVSGASDALAKRTGLDAAELAEAFRIESQTGLMPLSRGVAAPNLRHHDIDSPTMVLVRCHDGVALDLEESFGHLELDRPIHAFVFLVSPENQLGSHLRTLAQVATRVDDEDFVAEWLATRTHDRLRQLLLRDERFLHLRLAEDDPTSEIIDVPVCEMGLPPGALIALVRRSRRTFVPQSDTVLRENDRLTIIGNPDVIEELGERFSRPVLGGENSEVLA